MLQIKFVICVGVALCARLCIVSNDVLGGNIDRQSLIAFADAESSFCLRSGLSVGKCHISLL